MGGGGRELYNAKTFMVDETVWAHKTRESMGYQGGKRASLGRVWDK